MYRALETTVYAVLVALLLGVVFLLIGTRFELPGNYQIKIVRSGSMEPNIHTGAMILVRPEDSYTVGDIITFGADTQTQIPTTHRIIGTTEKRGETLFLTQGDANEEQDPEPVSEDEIIGKVILDVSSVGYVLDFARQPLGFALLIGVPAAIIIFDELAKIIHELARRKRKKRMEEHIAARLRAQRRAPEQHPTNVTTSNQYESPTSEQEHSHNGHP